MKKRDSDKKGGFKAVLRIYFQHARKYPLLLILLFIGTVGVQAAELTSPLFLRQFFNVLAENTPNSETVRSLVGIIAMIGALSFASWVARRLQQFSIIYVESRVMSDLLGSAFIYLIGHSYNFFTSNFAGTLTHRVNKFARAFEAILDSLMLQFFPTFLYTVGAVIVLLHRNIVLGMALAIWVVVFVAFQIYVAKMRQPLRVIKAEEDSKVTGALADAIGNHTTITLFSGSRFEHTRFGEAVERWRKAMIRSWNADELIWALQGLLMIGINVGMLYGATVFWRQGLLTIGDFVLIQAYLIGTFNMLMNINQMLRRIYDVFAEAGQMVEILETPHEVKDKFRAKSLTVANGEIAFSSVDFYFNSTRPVLTGFNLSIRGGEKVALIGPSGAGKSTITKLLLRMYDVSKGSITIDGQDIAKVTQDSLREAIAFVPQEPILFHRTLMENIRYSRRDATDEEVIEAAKKAHCHEFISQLPDTYDTFVGERGIKLSGGERQRVAIARALLKNAPILVLDEATSSLDSESELLIQDALEVLMQGKTVVVIAHRLSTIMKMDRIIVIDGGRVADQGTHDELLSRDGLYQKLWNIQAGGFLREDEES